MNAAAAVPVSEVEVRSIASLPRARQEIRARHVGASEVAALFDLHPQLTRFELWHLKAGNLPADDLADNDRVFWGTVLEPAVARGLAERTGWSLRKVRRYVPHEGVLGMGCSPDYEVVSNARGPGIAEIKNVDRLVFLGWEDGQAPMHMQLQLQHQLACTRRGWGALGMLVGGNDLVVQEFERHEAAIARIEIEIANFWGSIERGEEPKPDFLHDLATIQALYGTATTGSVLDVRDNRRVHELCSEYEAARLLEKDGKGRKESAKAEILTIIRDAETAIGEGWKISASNVDSCHVEYERAPYRTFRVTSTQVQRRKSK